MYDEKMTCFHNILLWLDSSYVYRSLAAQGAKTWRLFHWEILLLSSSDSLFGWKAGKKNSFNMTLWNANYMGLIHVYAAYNLYNNAMVFQCGFVFIKHNSFDLSHQPLTSHNSVYLIQYSQYFMCGVLRKSHCVSTFHFFLIILLLEFDTMWRFNNLFDNNRIDHTK